MHVRPAPSSTAAVSHGGDLGAALGALRSAVSSARYPLNHGRAEAAREAARVLLEQLDDYVVPRAARLDAPVLAVVGGSTGAGKSTLVNSLVRAPVSRSGVLRPTTRGPVLVCHPADSGWFGGTSLLSGLTRGNEPGEGVLQVVSAPLLRQGVALLDAPDVDSVVAANRSLAHELLGAADLWLFVTTASRYADEVPWQALRGARDRGTVVAVVLDRVPPQAREDVTADLSRLLSEQGLPAAPLFTVDESTLDGQGLLPHAQLEPIEDYLTGIATSEVRRRAVTRRTLLGAIASAAATADDLAFAAVEQCAAADALAATVRDAFHRATVTVTERLADGTLLGGGVYARWRESVASGELQRALRATQDPSRARPAPAPPGRLLQAAIATALSALLVEAETRATEEIADRWYVHTAGRALLAAGDEESGDHGAVEASELVRGWHTWLREEARLAAPPTRTRTRGSTTASLVMLATVAAVAPHAAQVTAPGTASQALRRVLAEPAVAGLAAPARVELIRAVSEHFAARSQRWLRRVERCDVDRQLAQRLRQAAADVSVARQLTLVLGRAA